MPDKDQDEENVRATYSIRRSFWRWLKHKAADEDTTASELVERMVKEEMEKEKKGKGKGEEKE